MGVPEFPQIYAAYSGRVLEYAAKLIGRDEAEDVAQEVFIKISKSLGSLQDPSRLTSWIYAITINTVRDAVRRRAVRGDRAAGACDTGDGNRGDEDALARIADTRSPSPEERTIRNEMVRCYLDYVERLPPHYYQVYALREFEQLSNDEIARRLSLTLDTVKIRLHRARAKLHEELRRNCRCYVNERGDLMGEPRED